MKAPFLVGTKVVLRSLLAEDLAGDYISWLNDAEVCKYNSHHVFPYTTESALDYISRSASNENLILAIDDKETSKHIGNVALQRIHAIDQNAEFAILLGSKAHWRHGYGREAAWLICNHGFNALNLIRIYCGTSDNNMAMQRLAQYLGMQQEGCSRRALFKNGQFHDLLHYAVLREEFPSQGKRDLPV